MQLLMAMSTSLHFPPIGTAGLQRLLVNGSSRVPWPPPMTMHRTLGLTEWQASKRNRAIAMNFVNFVQKLQLSSFFRPLRQP
jgi:hypothetical protein